MDHAPVWSVGGVLISLSVAVSPWVDKPLKSVPHGQCDARPTVTFLASEHHRPLAGTKLYCLVTEARVCEQLAQGRYLVVERLGMEPKNLCVSVLMTVYNCGTQYCTEQF